MLQHPTNLTPARSGDTRSARRRGRFAPVRRIRRILTTGLCAGAALLSGAALQAQQPVTPVGYNAALRGHSANVGHGHGNYCAPRCAPYAYPAAPQYQEHHQYQPYYGGEPTPADAPRPGDMGDQAQDQTQNQAQDQAMPDFTPAPVPSAPSLSGATGTPTAPASAMPNSVGDFYEVTDSATIQGGAYASYYIPNPSASVVGRIKAAENNNPLPQDRVFFDYTYYHNVPLATPDVGVVRMVPGIERTFLDGLGSVELRVPFAQTLDNSFDLGGDVDGDSWEIGNLYGAFKVLLYQDSALAFSTGLGVSAPTAEDLEFGGGLEVDNRSVHLLPFVGAAFTPNETFFGQAYAQLDIDTNGNPIIAPGGEVGRWQDREYLYLDGMLGAWLYDDPFSDTLRSVAGVVEFHYTTSLDDSDSVTFGGTTIAAGEDDVDFYTAMVGLHLFYAGGAGVTFGYGVPLLDDRFADGEFRLMLNWGPPMGGVPSLAGR